MTGNAKNITIFVIKSYGFFRSNPEMGEGEAVAFGIEPSAFLAEVTSFFSKVF